MHSESYRSESRQKEERFPAPLCLSPICFRCIRPVLRLLPLYQHDLIAAAPDAGVGAEAPDVLLHDAAVRVVHDPAAPVRAGGAPDAAVRRHGTARDDVGHRPALFGPGQVLEALFRMVGDDDLVLVPVARQLVQVDPGGRVVPIRQTLHIGGIAF